MSLRRRIGVPRSAVNVHHKTKLLIRQASMKMQKDEDLLNPPFLFEVIHRLVVEFLQEDGKKINSDLT